MNTGSAAFQRRSSFVYIRLAFFAYIKGLHVFPMVVAVFGSAHIWKIVGPGGQVFRKVVAAIKRFYGYAFVGVPKQGIVGSIAQVFADTGFPGFGVNRRKFGKKRRFGFRFVHKVLVFRRVKIRFLAALQ